MKSLAALAFLLVTASAATAQPPPRELFEDAPITLSGEIVGVDLSAPMSKLRLKDTLSGTTWVIEGASSNTLARSGISPQVAGTMTVVGFPAKDKACAPDCRLRFREITFPDGRKVFLGAAGPRT